MSGPVRPLSSFSAPAPAAEVTVGSTPVQSVAMALLRQHELIDASRDSMGTYRILMNHLSWELPMIRGALAPWKEKELLDEKHIPIVETRSLRKEAGELEKRLRSRKHAHDVKIHVEPLGGSPPKYMIVVEDPNNPTLDPPLIVYGVDLPGVLQVKHESQKEATFESAVIELFSIHLEGHNLLADAGILDLATSISNLRGYSRQDKARELAETVRAREQGEQVVGLSAFSNHPTAKRPEPDEEPEAGGDGEDDNEVGDSDGPGE